MQYETSAIRKGLKVIENQQPHVVVDFQFVKPGKGNAFTRTRLKSLITGNVLDRTYKTGEKLEKAELDQRKVQYIYPEGENRVFMDMEDYQQYPIGEDVLGDVVNYLTEGLECDLLIWESKPISVDPPNFVVLEVVSCGAGAKSDRATAVTKDAEVSTGHTIQVPLFINEGDSIKIDTRSGEYVERAKK